MFFIKQIILNVLYEKKKVFFSNPATLHLKAKSLKPQKLVQTIPNSDAEADLLDYRELSI